ncbi:MAG: hypothetical protein KatS3mg014_0979 [Actinomycetota bacterium]|nr:MAG: hypothetical protein KatS3mg014_0979 [Actinomycetota bacterium]
MATGSLLALGTEAPDFALPDVRTGEIVRRSDFDGKKGLLVLFICRHCPYVKHVEAGIAQLARDYAEADLGIVAISANDPEAYPEDAPESLAEQARLAGFTFPYLFDETQEVAKAYTAACTPDPLPVRRAPSARVPRPARREPPRQRRAGDLRGHPARDRRRPRRTAGPPGPAAGGRLQHQVAARQRAGVPARHRLNGGFSR